MSASCETVDIAKLMRVAFGTSEIAVMCMVSHGQVRIDGHVMRAQWMKHWTAEQLQGRVLKCPRGEYRIVGSRLEKHHEQMRMA
jgi:hypothetical protein